MIDLGGLLAEIYANPDDDGARAVYADALLERGDVRGELILAQLRGSRAVGLIDQHGSAWLGPLAAITLRVEFERGFPARLAIDCTRADTLTRVAMDPRWSTIQLVELGGHVRVDDRDLEPSEDPPGLSRYAAAEARNRRLERTRRRLLEQHQTAAIVTLATAPGAARREFRPSLTQLAEREARRNVRK